MDMDEYKSNSHKSREEANKPEKKIEKIVTGEVKTKKHGGFRKLADIFLAEDIGEVKSFIIHDILIPAIKKAISDIITNGTDMLMYGKDSRRKSTPASRIDYGGCFDKRNSNRSPVRMGYSYQEITLSSRSEAEDVLTRMDELISMYNMVSVADLYDLVGVTGTYTDNNYGWTDIRNASVVRVRDGYMIKMPKALPLEK